MYNVTCFIISLFTAQHVSNVSTLSSGVCDLLWIYLLGCIALARCVLVLRCGSAGVVWYLYAGCSTYRIHTPPTVTVTLKKSFCSFSSFHSILLTDGPVLWNKPRNISLRFFPIYLPQTILILSSRFYIKQTVDITSSNCLNINLNVGTTAISFEIFFNPPFTDIQTCSVAL